MIKVIDSTPLPPDIAEATKLPHVDAQNTKAATGLLEILRTAKDGAGAVVSSSMPTSSLPTQASAAQ